ncbi:MAG: hypothetical protein P1V81_04130 [Planctomycetota bacterium]|nr:hypothetical protein [Planctomycetota bacterium]
MKPLLVALAAALLALGLWFVLQPAEGLGTNGGPAPDLAPTETSADGAGSKTGPQLEATADQPTGEARDREAVAVEPGSLHPDFGLLLSEPTEGGVTFEVVVEGTDTPVPFAIVTALSEREATEGGARELLMAGAGFDEVLDRFGLHRRCDADGHVRLTGLDAQVMLRARGMIDGQRHSGMLEGDPDARRIEVRPEQGFDVTVLDPAGGPLAGSGVQLIVERSFGADAQRMSFHRAETGADGHTFLVNTFLHLHEQSESMLGREGTRVLVSLAGLYGERPEVDIDWRTTTPETIELTSPLVGRVVVDLHLSDGSGLPRGTLCLVRAGEPEGLLGIPGEGNLVHSVGGSAGGGLVFEGIERGMAFDLIYYYDGSSETFDLRGLSVPSDRDELVVDFELAIEQRLLRARLLLPGGEPLVDADVLVGRLDRPWSESVERLDRVRTDGAGRIEAPAPWLVGEGLVLVHTTTAGEQLQVEVPGLSDDVLETRGDVDLGDLQLAGDAVLVAGRVVDQAGLGVSLRLRLLEAGQPATALADSLDPELAYAEVVRFSGKRWSVTSNDDGSFELLGHTSEAMLAIELSSESYYLPQPILVPVGSADARISVDRAATFGHDLSGLDPNMASGLWITILPSEGASTSHSYAEGLASELAPGSYQYSVTLGDTAPVVATGLVELAAGQHTDLGPLVPDGQVHHYEVHLTVEGEHSPGLLGVSGSRLAKDHDGHDVYVRCGSVKWGGDKVWHLFSMTPLARLEVQYGLHTEVHPANEGLTQLTLQVPEGADEAWEYFKDQGYL